MGTAYHPQSSSTEWSTPYKLFDQIDEEFCFELDAAATALNTLCLDFLELLDEDSMETEWLRSEMDRKTVWLNPPWGRGIGKWVERAFTQSQKHGLTTVCLLPANTDTKWWRDWVWKASEVRFVTSRLHFVCEDGRTGPCPTGACVVVFCPWSSGPPSFSLISGKED